MMDDVYTVVRGINFAWASILAFLMIYWGFQDIMLTRRCGHVQFPPEHSLWALSTFGGCVLIFIASGEVLLQHLPGGIRVFTPAGLLLPASFALHQGAFRVKMHREAIAKGLCGDNDYK